MVIMEDKRQKVRQVLIITLILNSIVLAIKAVVGIMTGS